MAMQRGKSESLPSKYRITTSLLRNWRKFCLSRWTANVFPDPALSDEKTLTDILVEESGIA